MVKKAYLERATTKELLDEVRKRAVKARKKGEESVWNGFTIRMTQDLLGSLPKDILEFKEEW